MKLSFELRTCNAIVASGTSINLLVSGVIYWKATQIPKDSELYSFFSLFALVLLVVGSLVWIGFGLFIRTKLSHEIKFRETTGKIQENLKSENEELKAVIDAFPGRISWIDRELKYLAVNRELANAFNKKIEEFEGVKVGSFSPDYGKPFLDLLTNFYTSDQERFSNYFSMGDPPKVKHFMTTLSKYSRGQKIMAISIDISGQKVLEQEVKEAQNKAERNARLSALGEMASGMAHEINNPLAIIFAKATFLRRSFEEVGIQYNKEKVIESLLKIENTADRIAKIIKGLQTMSRDGEKDPFQRTIVRTIISDTVELCRYRLYNKEIRFESPELDPRVFFECRPTQIVQVLVNLINNAYDAIQFQKEKWIRLEFKSDEHWVEFAVADAGKGIPAEIVEKIMQPFFTTKETGKGTGLGLSISKGIAESHNGSLTLDAKSVNTRFVLRIPRLQASDVPKAA